MPPNSERPGMRSRPTWAAKHQASPEVDQCTVTRSRRQPIAARPARSAPLSGGLSAIDRSGDLDSGTRRLMVVAAGAAIRSPIDERRVLVGSGRGEAGRNTRQQRAQYLPFSRAILVPRSRPQRIRPIEPAASASGWKALEDQPVRIGPTFRLFKLVSAVKHLQTRIL